MEEWFMPDSEKFKLNEKKNPLHRKVKPKTVSYRI
jgi:hypothetical protein